MILNFAYKKKSRKILNFLIVRFKICCPIIGIPKLSSFLKNYNFHRRQNIDRYEHINIDKELKNTDSWTISPLTNLLIIIILKNTIFCWGSNDFFYFYGFIFKDIVVSRDFRAHIYLILSGLLFNEHKRIFKTYANSQFLLSECFFVALVNPNMFRLCQCKDLIL